MSADPFPGRCRRCGIPMMEDVDECGRGPACRTDREFVRDLVAGACSAVLRAARRLGLVR